MICLCKRSVLFDGEIAVEFLIRKWCLIRMLLICLLVDFEPALYIFILFFEFFLFFTGLSFVHFAHVYRALGFEKETGQMATCRRQHHFDCLRDIHGDLSVIYFPPFEMTW